MNQATKTLDRMRANPTNDWKIADLQHLALRYGIEYRQPGTSHVTFSFAGVEPLTVPAHKPIKPVYIRRFVALVDRVKEGTQHD
jgi:hypothetical protein